MSNIVLISAYCDTEEKLNILRKNLKIIKSKKIDTAIISPLTLPKDVIKLSNYVFITKENPVLDWPERSIAIWKTLPNYNCKLLTSTPDYGFAGLNHVKRLGEIFINYDYQYFTFIIYDTIITSQVLKVLEKGHDSIVYPSKFKDSHIIFNVSLHLLSLNKENLKKVINKIDFKEYKKSRIEWDVEAYLQYKIINPLNINVGDFVVEDEIFFYEDLFNHSNSPLFNYFIHTPDENHINPEIDHNLGIIFYNLENPLHLNFDINNKISKFKIENGNFINLGIKKSSVESISFKYKDQIFDLTEQILKLKHTRIITNV